MLAPRNSNSSKTLTNDVTVACMLERRSVRLPCGMAAAFTCHLQGPVELACINEPPPFNRSAGETPGDRMFPVGSRLPSVEVQDISQVYANGARGPSQQLHPSLAAQQQHMPQQPLPAPPNGSIPLWQEPVQAAVPPPNHHANGSQVPPAMHAHVPTATPPIQGAAPAHMSPPQPPQVNMADVAQNAPDSPGSQDNGSRSSGHRPSRRQTKTERQQMLNKAAQQR